MKLRRKSEEEELDELEEEVKPRSRKKANVKDLKPENKKKRKEPPKPWGKSERYLVFALLLVTTLMSGVLALSARSGHLPGIPRIKLPKNPFEQTYILDKSTPPQTEEEIRKKITQTVNPLAGVYGVYVLRPYQDTAYGVNEHEEFTASSLIALPIMVAAYMEAEEGNLNLAEEYTLAEEDKVKGEGSLYHKREGEKFTYRELIHLIGQQSDKTATNILRKTLGDELLEKYINDFGMQSTALLQDKTTPYDVAVLLEKLLEGKLLEENAREELLEALTDTAYEAWLTKGVPGDVQVAHKYAKASGVVHDAGIVNLGKPYIVVVLSKGVIEGEADQAIPKLSQLVYGYEASK